VAEASFVKGAAILCALALSACGAGSESGEGGDALAASGGMPKNWPGNWKATDACSVLDKAAVSAELKVEVAETQLGLVNEPGEQTAATSECVYVTSDGSRVASLMTRWSPINDNTAEVIATARSTTASAMSAFTDSKIEDIAGVGKSAFIVPGINQLNVFLDDARMIVLTVEKVPDGASGKDVTVALARKAGA